MRLVALAGQLEPPASALDEAAKLALKGDPASGDALCDATAAHGVLPQVAERI